MASNTMNMNIDAKDVAASLTIKVKVKRLTQWKVRTWFAIQLIKLAAWVGWMNVDVDTTTTDNIKQFEQDKGEGGDRFFTALACETDAQVKFLHPQNEILRN